MVLILSCGDEARGVSHEVHVRRLLWQAQDHNLYVILADSAL